MERSSGKPVRATTDPMELGSVILESLSERAIEWSRAPRSIPIDGVIVDPNLISLKGRVSGVIDADSDGLTDLRRRRPHHEEADGLAFIHDEIARLGPTAFAEYFGIPVDTAKKLSSGRRPSAATARTVLAALRSVNTTRTCALDGCDAPVGRAKYCSKAHRDRGYRQRQKSLRQHAPDPFADVTCIGCGTVLLGAAALGPCPVCSTPTEVA